MNIELASKLLKYSPADVQTATYVVEYAQHNYDADAAIAYIDKRLAESKTQREIAEIILDERYKGKHGQSSAEYKDDRSPGGKMVSGDSKQSGAEYTHGRRVKAANPGSQPDEGGKTKPKSQGKMDAGTRADLQYRKANLKKEEVEIEEGYKEIDKKKENAMYRRAGNLARTSLSSKGKEKEVAQKKSAKIVSAIARQKENERFERIGKDPKHQNNYKEELEIEEGLKQARKNIGMDPDKPSCWDGYVAKGTKMKNGKEVPNCVPANEEWIWDLVDELAEDFEFFTDEDLEDVIIEALVDLEDEELLQEAVASFEGLELLNEDRYADAVAASKANAAKPEVKAAVRRARVERVKKAAGRVGSALKSKASEVAGKAKEAAGKAKESAGKAASSAKSAVKSAGKKAVETGAKAAGHAVGTYQAARIKAKREALSKSKPSGGSKPAEKKPEGKDKTGGKLDDLLKSVRGSSSSSSSSGGSSSSGSSNSSGSSSSSSSSGGSSSGGSSSSEGGTKKKSLLRRAAGAVGRGLKKVVGKTARVVAKGSDKLARKLGEENSMESRTDRIRRLVAMQETVDHDKATLRNPEGISWRDRLGMQEEKTPEQKAKSAALAKSKELTKQGKHKEASEVFKKAFPNFGK